MTYIIVFKYTKFGEDRLTVFEIFSKNPQGAILPPVQIGLIICAQTTKNLLYIVALYAPFINNRFSLFGALNSCDMLIFYCWGALSWLGDLSKKDFLADLLWVG